MQLIKNLFYPNLDKLLRKYNWQLDKDYSKVKFYKKEDFELEIEFYDNDISWYLTYPNNKDGYPEKTYIGNYTTFFKLVEEDFINFDIWINEYKNGKF